MEKTNLSWEKINILFKNKNIEIYKLWCFYDIETKKNNIIFIECFSGKFKQSFFVKIPNSRILIAPMTVSTIKISQSETIDISKNQKELLKNIYNKELQIRYSLLTNTELILFSTIEKDIEKYVINSNLNKDFLELGEIKIVYNLSNVKSEYDFEKKVTNDYNDVLTLKTNFYFKNFENLKQTLENLFSKIQHKIIQLEKKELEYKNNFTRLENLREQSEINDKIKLLHRNTINDLFEEYNKISNNLSIIISSSKYLIDEIEILL